jgi:hypothetical protein
MKHVNHGTPYFRGSVLVSDHISHAVEASSVSGGSNYAICRSCIDVKDAVSGVFVTPTNNAYVLNVCTNYLGYDV